jgi:hypothetical protein
MTAPADWIEGTFFETTERESVDGGVTSSGTLWHGVSPRWGHSMHTMCSYHGMFPAKVAHYFIQRYSSPRDVVLDPFSGRGTVPLQARAEGRRAVCNDLNPLAYVLSGAKVNPPAWDSVQVFLRDLEKAYRRSRTSKADAPDDISMLYNEGTLRQICFVRRRLLSKPLLEWSPEELMIGGSLAGIMHGSYRRDGTSQYLSISMPNTFSMSPGYVRNYIRRNELKPLDQDVFECLRDKLARLYLDDSSGLPGTAYHDDAASLLTGHGLEEKTVDLVVTSPPYLQVVNYGTSNWIRLWLLGLDEVGREGGAGRKKLDAALDHGHGYVAYKDFLLRSLKGVRRVLKSDGVAVFMIGDVADPGKDPVPLAAQIWRDLGGETGLRLLDLVEDHLPIQNKVSRIWGETKGQATARDCALVLARDDGEPRSRPMEVD